LWFSEHWLIDEQIKTLNTDQYKLADNFSKVKCNYGGTCIFVQEDSYTKELKYLKDLYSEKEFEMSAVELVDFKFVVICVYKSAHTDVYGFLNKLETLSGKNQLNRKKFILCGD
jgi:exonuclease III